MSSHYLPGLSDGRGDPFVVQKREVENATSRTENGKRAVETRKQKTRSRRPKTRSRKPKTRSRKRKSENAKSMCKRNEGAVKKICRRKKACSNVFKAYPLTTIDAADRKIHQNPFPVQCLPTQCIFCMGDEGPSLTKRTKSFRDRKGLNKTFFPEALAISRYEAAN